MGTTMVLWPIFVPIVGACLLPLIGKFSSYIRNMLALVLILMAFIFSAIMLPQAIAAEPIYFYYQIPLGFSFGFLADNLAIFMALIASLVAAIIVFYSFGYMEHYDNQNEYYFMVTLFIGAMMGLVYATNLLFIYIFWEISAICCWRLIGFYRDQNAILRADKAFLITVGGALLMLVGFIGIYMQTGTFNLPDMNGNQLSTNLTILILCGILSKSATLPFHTWLPDAGVAPSPVTSLLHAAVLVKIGVYVYARLFLVHLNLDIIWHDIIPLICAISAIVSAGAAIVENDIKRIIAYSTISQLAFILLGLSSGTMIGAAGGLLYIFMHSLAKAGLFLCAGIIEHSTHTKDIRQISGLYRRLPATMISFAFCAFSVMGIPPFGGFFSKYMVINGALLSGNTWLTITFLIGAVMTIIYLMRLFIKVFFGELSHPDLKEGTWEMVAAVMLLALLSLLSGLFINIPAQLTEYIISSLGRW